MKKVIFGLALSLFFLATVATQAQDEKKLPLPIDKIGLGVRVDVNNLGGSFAYAIQNNVHIGTGIGISYISGYEGENNVEIEGGLQFMFSPFFRYIFNNIGNFFPYGELNFKFTEIPNSAAIQRATASSSDVNIEFGGMWFPFTTVSVRGGVNFVNFNIDKSLFGIGIGYPFMGIDWWFN